MADNLIPFPRLLGTSRPVSAKRVTELFADAEFWRDRPGCANGMPGHPPCRSPAELEAMLRAQGDTTAARESV